MKTITKALFPKMKRALKDALRLDDGTEVNEALTQLLEHHNSSTDVAMYEVGAMLLAHCNSSYSKLLPKGTDPELVAATGLPVAQIPQMYRLGERHFHALTQVARQALPPLSPGYMRRLTEGGAAMHANRTGMSLFEVSEATRILYAEPSKCGDGDMRIGTGGTLTLYWKEGLTAFRSGVVHDATLELINHAGSRPQIHSDGLPLSYMHLSAVVSLKLDERGKITSITPGSDTKEKYRDGSRSVKVGTCMCPTGALPSQQGGLIW